MYLRLGVKRQRGTENKIGNGHINVAMRRVRVIIVSVEKQ